MARTGRTAIRSAFSGTGKRWYETKTGNFIVHPNNQYIFNTVIRNNKLGLRLVPLSAASRRNKFTLYTSTKVPSVNVKYLKNVPKTNLTPAQYNRLLKNLKGASFMNINVN